MKKLFITAMFAIAIVTSSFANSEIIKTKTAIEINKAIKAGVVSLKVTDNFKKATLVIEGERIEMFYAIDGSLIGISKTFAYDKLPKSAIKSLATDYAYPSYDLKECIVFENTHNEINYYVSLLKDNELVVVKISEFGSVSEL